MTEFQPVTITLYRWAGSWGPFEISISCGECALTHDVIADTMINELADIAVDLQVRDWLSHWWKPLKKRGWHAPIVMVEGRVISQGAALNRGLLTQAVIEAYAKTSVVEHSLLFGKQSCPHCQRAKGYLEKAGVEYQYFDVVSEPRALYEMLARVKPLISAKTPVTVPQIWLDGHYIGGADELGHALNVNVVPNFERGQCSLSPKRRKT